MIADEVGLGKTFLAGELIREAVQERRQRVLMICPATLRDGMWRKFLATYQLSSSTRSFDDLAADKRLNDEADGIKLLPPSRVRHGGNRRGPEPCAIRLPIGPRLATPPRGSRQRT